MEITPELVAEHGLSAAEYARIEAALGRAPNRLELGIFSVMWSEHCSYKSSRVHLAKLPTSAPWVIQGPGENAGVIDIGDGWAAVFKMESHNHPSFIEPYQGAATGVGGIMRDVFTMGARPVALMNALRFGSPDAPRMKHLIRGVVAGIGGYGNCVGVPTVGGETGFDAGYDGNILVNAMCVGVARADAIFYSAAAGVGNSVVYVGSKTGRDGIHGATMASAEFSADTEEKRPTVQVGDPFTEKLLIEACLELMATGAIVAIQDMGAAGLTSSSVEMASKGGVGIELDMDAVPCREEGMTPYEMMLSESQERMLIVLRPGREAEAETIFTKWELDFAVIGRVTDTGRLVLNWRGETVADLPLAPIGDDAPRYERPFTRTPPAAPLGDIPESADIAADLLKLMASPELCSRRWIWEQYDHMVGADTVQRPGGDAAVVRVHGTRKALAITTDCTPRYCLADPYEGGKQAVAEAYRNLIAVGAKPLAITDCLNFGNPENPVVMGQLVGCIEGMAEACRALDFPVVSGNVSLYNDTEGRPIPPTPAIGAVGLIEDWSNAQTLAFKAEGQAIILIGGEPSHLGQSLWARRIDRGKGERPPSVCLEAERKTGAFITSLIADNWKSLFTSCDIEGTIWYGLSPLDDAALFNVAQYETAVREAVEQGRFASPGRKLRSWKYDEPAPEPSEEELAAFSKAMHEREDPPLSPRFEAWMERAQLAQQSIREEVESSQSGLTAVHDISDGGLAVALAEMSLAGGIGAAVVHSSEHSLTGFFFGEDQARYLVTVRDPDPVLSRAASAGVSAVLIGATQGDTLDLGTGAPIPLAALRAAHEGALPRLMGKQGAAGPLLAQRA